MGGKFFKRSRAMVVAAGAAAVTLAGGQALAGGDSPYQPYEGASAGRTIWEGFHVGAHAGWSDNDYNISQSTGPVSPLVTVRDSEDAFIGGFVYGSSWQFGNIVLGTDSAWNFGDLETGRNVAANGTSARAEVRWSAETRARAGFLVQPNTLLYGTVGLASAGMEVSGSLVGGSRDENVYGVVYGGGIEHTWSSRWFARLEYLHTDYDNESFRQPGGGRLRVDLDNDTVRGAVGYRFDWSPLDLITGN